MTDLVSTSLNDWELIKADDIIIKQFNPPFPKKLNIEITSKKDVDIKVHEKETIEVRFEVEPRLNNNENNFIAKVSDFGGTFEIYSKDQDNVLKKIEVLFPRSKNDEKYFLILGAEGGIWNINGNYDGLLGTFINNAKVFFNDELRGNVMLDQKNQSLFQCNYLDNSIFRLGYSNESTMVINNVYAPTSGLELYQIDDEEDNFFRDDFPPNEVRGMSDSSEIIFPYELKIESGKISYREKTLYELIKSFLGIF